MNSTSPIAFRRADAASKEQALRAAIDCLGAYIIRFFYGYTRDWKASEELASDLWVYVFQRFAVDKYQNLNLLLWKAKKMAIDYWKKSARQHVPTSPDALADGLIAATYVEPSTQAEELAAYNRFWEMFPSVRLTEPQKQAFWYCERYGYTLEETGQRLGGKSATTIHGWVERVKERCAAYLNQEDQQ